MSGAIFARNREGYQHLRRRLEELTEYRGQTIDAGEFTPEVNTEGAILPDNLSGTRTAPNGPL